MSVAVLIPYAGGDTHRALALDWVRLRYEWPVVIGTGDADKWCKADAVARALQQTDADTLVVADADVWTPNVDEAVRAVERGASWAMPHRTVRRLTEVSTLAVLSGAMPDKEMELDRNEYAGVIGGGVVVLKRALYDEVPLDSRFIGWGGEDYAWGFALRTIAGSGARLSGPLWHLWHPPAPRDAKVKIGGNAENEALRRRYRGARADIQRMRALVGAGVADPSARDAALRRS
jgi:hypothetical protein